MSQSNETIGEPIKSITQVTTKTSKIEPRLTIYKDRSELQDETGATIIFKEGNRSAASSKRYKSIQDSLEAGYLDTLIQESGKADIKLPDIDPVQQEIIKDLVDSITSEQGRALVGLTIMQLVIKTISPEQSIRLHKGSKRPFSWEEGISMRGLDADYITPTLRKHNLLSINAFGIMMTRSLAENYPYSQFYKAAIKGAGSKWLQIVDWVEKKEADPKNLLIHILYLLQKQSEKFKNEASNTLKSLEAYNHKERTEEEILSLIRKFVDLSTYSARIFEICIHALFQVLEDYKLLHGHLKPLSQMRSANKKHGNLGDVEITESKGGLDIIEAWDAKYGKPYLRDELDELGEKLQGHPENEIVGFITDNEPNMKEEIINTITDLELVHDNKVYIFSFDEWFRAIMKRYHQTDMVNFAKDWLTALTESICQKRRERAPIDEPSFEWVETLNRLLK